MRVLVTGASGFIGAALCRELLARGHAVRAAVRSATAAGSAEIHQVVVPDLAAEFDRRALLEGIDTIVHLAAIAHRGASETEIHRVNVEATARLAEAAIGAVRRFVFMSSVKVHGEDSGEGFYTENSPTRPRDAYARAKLDTERLLGNLASRGKIDLVVLRPPLVYGPGVKANFLSLLRWVDSGVPLPFASLRNRRSLIYIGNLVDALVRCVEHPAAIGPFLFADDEAVSTPELVSRIARALGVPARLLRVPTGFLRVLGTVSGRGEEVQRLTGNLVVNTARSRRLLDWRPPGTLDAGLAETARWFRSRRG